MFVKDTTIANPFHQKLCHTPLLTQIFIHTINNEAILTKIAQKSHSLVSSVIVSR